MTTTITAQDGTGATTTPRLVMSYEASNETRNQVHDTLDGGILVALYPARPRSGTLHLFYLTEADADAARVMHTRETSFTLSSTERPSINMAYVVVGSARIVLDPDTRQRWTVDVGFQEIVV